MSLRTLPSYRSVARGDDEDSIGAYRIFHHHDEKETFVKGYEASLFFAVIVAQTHLRESTQREEALREKLEEYRERTTIDPNDEDVKAQIQQLEGEIARLKRKLWSQEQALYRAEWSMTDELHHKYDAVRENAA
jgi:chromosome segregation ATPase